MGFAHKRSTYIITPFPIKYQVVTSDKDAQGTNEAKDVKKQKKEVNSQEDIISELAQQEENKAYIALLFKTQKYNRGYISEMRKYFSFDEIIRLIDTYSEEQLAEKSKKHHAYLEKYEMHK